MAIKREFGVSYHPDHCGYLVRKMGYCMQKPVERATGRNEQAIEHWKAHLDKDLLQCRQISSWILAEPQLFATRLAPKGEVFTHGVPRVRIFQQEGSW